MSHRLIFPVIFLLLLCCCGTAFCRELPGFSKVAPGEGASVKTDQGFLVPYQEKIPGTDITFEMIPIPAGTFLMGSPATEDGRAEDEGPQVRVEVPAFWMGKCEVTWAEYHEYMATYEAFKSFGDLQDDPAQLETLEVTSKFLDQQPQDVDAITSPTPLYEPSFTYYPGEEPDQPAVTMTQYAAKQYTKWLSGIIGRQYRLPTEAEWEYAARAGTTTAYSFGDSASGLDQYAWHEGNSEEETHVVGTKQPNAWGLFDMHGNAAEWVLDGYLPDHYASLGDGVHNAKEAVAWPAKVYPRVIRGGSWLDQPQQCRSAARFKSDDPEWKISDPNLPNSPWWYTEDPTTGIGFRIVRPLEAMDQQQRKQVWDADNKWITQDVADRLEEGRGAQGTADPLLPAAIQELREQEIIE